MSDQEEVREATAGKRAPRRRAARTEGQSDESRPSGLVESAETGTAPEKTRTRRTSRRGRREATTEQAAAELEGSPEAQAAAPRARRTQRTAGNGRGSAIAEANTVRRYLEALEAHKPRPGRRRTPESVRRRLDAIAVQLSDGLDPVTRLMLKQEQRDLDQELERMSKNDLSALEEEFVRVAARFGERKGISYTVWREIGVSPSVLRRAGITR